MAKHFAKVYANSARSVCPLQMLEVSGGVLGKYFKEKPVYIFLSLYILYAHIGTLDHFKTCIKKKSGLQLKFPQKYFPRTPPPTCNVWRGHIDLLESLLKICKSHSLSKLYTAKKHRLQKKISKENIIALYWKDKIWVFKLVLYSK